MTGGGAFVRTAVAAALLALAACGGAPSPPVDLAGGWPDRGGDYAEVTERWTRRDTFYDDFTEVASVSATFKSPEWRAAYVARRATREGLDRAGRDALLAEEKKAAAAAHEVVVLLTTYDRRSNDLAKRTRSIWTINLTGGDGRVVAPLEVLRDRRPEREIRAYFPTYGDFAEAYLVRFPADAAVFGPDAEKVALRIASGQGALEVVWRDR